MLSTLLIVAGVLLLIGAVWWVWQNKHNMGTNGISVVLNGAGTANPTWDISWPPQFLPGPFPTPSGYNVAVYLASSPTANQTPILQGTTTGATTTQVSFDAKRSGNWVLAPNQAYSVNITYSNAQGQGQISRIFIVTPAMYQ